MKLQSLMVGAAMILGVSSAAQASVDLDRVCMLNGKGYVAGDVVLAPQGQEAVGAKGIVCSMVSEQAMWLALNDQAVNVVQQKERADTDQQDLTK